MEFDHIIFEYAFDIFGGVLIGIAVLGQFFVNASTGKETSSDSTMRKVVGYSMRIGAAIVSLAVLVLVIRTIRLSTAITLYNVLAIAIGLLATIAFGWKKLTRRNNNRGQITIS